MILSKLLKIDERVQECVSRLSWDLLPHQCLFAVEYRFGLINFKKVKIKDKTKFRNKLRLFSKAHYLTNQQIDKDIVYILGLVLENRNYN
jgi:hypothetical protein